ncbi:phage tail protein [Bifidobacterium longum subsp. longum]|uniref:tape measure protein n=1 Tax=Bifidobacterium longum TaxID=216816 RepID=UPI00103B0F10|nr:tape measure protein [Bifidobacterium longum]TCF05141.1 phage tail protein [Bifidobacterium longum subsp. longum]
MAQDIGTVYVQVAPSGKDFGKTLEGDITGSVDTAARKSGGSLTGTLGKAFGKIGKLGLGAIGTITGGVTALAAKGGFTRALNIENAQAKLKGLGHDANSVSEIMNNALASVKGTAFGLGDAATVAASLSAAGIASGEQMTKVLKTVADTAQISGRSLTDIGTIFGSVAARGKLQGDDMLQLMSSGVPVLQMLAKHLNTTSEDVSDMVSKGKIDFQTFADAMQEWLGGAALAAGDTFSGALANVKAALSRLGEGPGKLALESLRKTFNAAIPAVDALSSQLTPFVEQLNGKLTPYVDRAVKLIEQFSQGLQDGSITVQDIVGSLGQLAGAFALFAGVGGNVDKITNVFDTLGKLGDGGLGQLTGKLKQMPGQLQSSLTGLQQFKSYFNKDLRDALELDGDPFASAVNRIRQGADKLTGPLKLLGAKIAGSDVGQPVAGMADRLGVGFGQLTSAFDSNIKVLGVRVGNGFSGVFSKITDSKLVSGLGAMAGKVQSALSPLASGLGDVFGGIGDIVGPKLQAGLGKIGSLFGSFFSPGNFMKYMGIAGIIAALVAGLGMLDQSMQGQLFAMIGQLSAQLPTLLQQLNMQITASLPAMLAQGAAILTALMNAISTNAPQLMTTAVLIITTLVNGLASQLPTLLPAALNMIMALVNGLASNAGQLLNSGMQLLLGLVEGLMNALPQLIAQAPTIIGNLVQSIAANLPQILQTGVKILVALANGLASAIPQLIAQIPAIVRSIWNGFTSVNWGEVGMNIITGIASGVTSAAGKLVDAAVNAAKDALNWVKDKLGIHSPSRVFRDQVGVMIGRGMAEGIDRSQEVVNRSLGELADGLTLDGYTFGMPTPVMSLPANACQMVNGTQSNQQGMQSQLDELLAEVKAFHEDMPFILQQLGINIDGREFGRAVRRYAKA